MFRGVRMVFRAPKSYNLGRLWGRTCKIIAVFIWKSKLTEIAKKSLRQKSNAVKI